MFEAPVIYKRQRKILDFIKQFIQMNKMSPTLREIGDAVGLSSLATVHEHLSALEKKKLIRRTGSGRVRSIIIETKAEEALGKFLTVPVLGFIAAGSPLEPYTDPHATLDLPLSFAAKKNRRIYVLQVRGESMIEDQIRDGDYVVIEEVSSARNGEIVVALLPNGMATLKRYYKEETRIRLEPANSTMSPIFAKNVRIQGRVIGLIRKFVN